MEELQRKLKKENRRLKRRRRKTNKNKLDAVANFIRECVAEKRPVPTEALGLYASAMSSNHSVRSAEKAHSYLQILSLMGVSYEGLQQAACVAIAKWPQQKPSLDNIHLTRVQQSADRPLKKRRKRKKDTS